MSGIKDQENIEELRKRLYGRDFLPEETKRHKLSETQVDVSRGWANSKPRLVTPPPVAAPETMMDMGVEEELEKASESAPPSKRRFYRIVVLLASLGLFGLVAIVSSVYLFFGANQISTKNISIDLNAPFAIAAGENLSMQISVGNQNTVPIESAVLIINYPVGTKSTGEQSKDLYEDRIPVESIAAGEALNIPVNVILFGEENEEKEIKASIEYRVAGSNGTFYREANPLTVKINSSPLVVRVEAVDKVSSGQEIEVKLRVQSNAATTQKNILLSASYPNSFTFVSSDPSPSYGQNNWLISEIAPESSQVITIKGRVSGVANEEAEIQLSAGSPRSDNQFIMGSVMTKAKTGYTIEYPFIDVEVGVNRDTDGLATIEAEVDSEVVVKVKNTLAETIYDMRVEVSPKGNLVRDNQLVIPSGFYDSSSKTIRYEVSGMPSLAEVRPGETREFTFTVKPDKNQKTGSFDISTSIFARRVSESNAAEEVVGTAVSQVKYSSKIELGAQVGHNDGIFADEGPVPPVADQTTTYTLTFVAQAGVNDISGAVMTTTLPQYVSWLDKYDGVGSVEYNPVAKQLKWSIGNVQAGTSKQLQVQVSLLPSVTQVGKTLTIVGAQELRATDSFTEVALRAQNQVLNTELSTEAGFSAGNGMVQSN